MIRVVEILMFVAPFAIFIAWRLLAPDTALSARHVVALGVALLATLALLAWMRMEDAEPPQTHYEPARIQGDQVTAPRASP